MEITKGFGVLLLREKFSKMGKNVVNQKKEKKKQKQANKFELSQGQSKILICERIATVFLISIKIKYKVTEINIFHILLKFGHLGNIIFESYTASMPQTQHRILFFFIIYCRNYNPLKESMDISDMKEFRNIFHIYCPFERNCSLITQQLQPSRDQQWNEIVAQKCVRP